MVNDIHDEPGMTFDEAFAIVATHPGIRVLRRFQQRPAYKAAMPGVILHRAAFIDFETTGLDPETAEVVEFGGAVFTFDEEGTIYTVGPTFSAYEQPSIPIPAEATAVHGITDDMVRGKVIGTDSVQWFLAGTELVIAHNAEYDRKIAERRWPTFFESLPWACSFRQVDWKRRGAVGAQLTNLLMHLRGQFHDAHRALDDVLVGIEVLNHRHMVAVDGDPGAWSSTALGELLTTTRSGIFRVYAHESPYEDKDMLKARGYFWTGDKPWKRDFKTREEGEAECRWLLDLRPCLRPQIKRIPATHRYSRREESRALPLKFRTESGPDL